MNVAQLNGIALLTQLIKVQLGGLNTHHNPQTTTANRKPQTTNRAPQTTTHTPQPTKHTQSTSSFSPMTIAHDSRETGSNPDRGG